MMTLGEKLRKLRENKGLKQNEAAAALKISNVNLNRYETNKHDPDLETISKLASFYSVTTDYLLGRVDNPMEKIATPADFDGENIGETVSTIALSRSDNPDADLPEEARKQIEEFRAYIRQKYKKPE